MSVDDYELCDCCSCELEASQIGMCEDCQQPSAEPSAAMSAEEIKAAFRSASFWRKWNLAYTKRVLANNPAGHMAQSLLSCWSPRIQGALLARYGATSSATHLPGSPDQIAMSATADA